jgi:hypothetical protein
LAFYDGQTQVKGYLSRGQDKTGNSMGAGLLLDRFCEILQVTLPAFFSPSLHPSRAAKDNLQRSSSSQPADKAHTERTQQNGTGSWN